jgi:hypothetical protein
MDLPGRFMLHKCGFGRYFTFDVKEGDGMYLPAEQRIKIFGE